MGHIVEGDFIERRGDGQYYHVQSGLRVFFVRGADPGRAIRDIDHDLLRLQEEFAVWGAKHPPQDNSLDLEIFKAAMEIWRKIDDGKSAAQLAVTMYKEIKSGRQSIP